MRRIRSHPFDDAAEPRVWLTFDDGPHTEHTATTLDALKAHGVPATFFVVGQRVARYGTDLLERARDEGHAVGNHSFTHPRLSQLSEEEVREELLRTDALIEPFHDEPKLFRPPYGDTSPTVLRVAEELGYRSIFWNVDPADWSRANQPDRWVELALEKLRSVDEAVVLLHDLWGTTADHVHLFIRQLKELGPVRFEPPSTLWRTPASEDRRAGRRRDESPAP